jgi:hypothetical protein
MGKLQTKIQPLSKIATKILLKRKLAQLLQIFNKEEDQPAMENKHCIKTSYHIRNRTKRKKK